LARLGSPATRKEKETKNASKAEEKNRMRIMRKRRGERDEADLGNQWKRPQQACLSRSPSCVGEVRRICKLKKPKKNTTVKK
jgi:hypothetical protein